MTTTTSNKKQRQFEPVLGNWPSFIYLPVQRSRNLKALSSACRDHFTREYLRAASSSATTTAGGSSSRGNCKNSNTAEENENELFAITDTAADDLHVSLSRPFVLRFHHIEPFVKRLGDAISSVISAMFFLPIYREYYVLSNDNLSRGFICLPVEDRSMQLMRLVSAVDGVLRSFNQPLYYEDPKFHISVGSFSLDNMSSSARESLPLDSYKPIIVPDDYDACLKAAAAADQQESLSSPTTTTAAPATIANASAVITTGTGFSEETAAAAAAAPTAVAVVLAAAAAAASEANSRIVSSNSIDTPTTNTIITTTTVTAKTAAAVSSKAAGVVLSSSSLLSSSMMFAAYDSDNSSSRDDDEDGDDRDDENNIGDDTNKGNGPRFNHDVVIGCNEMTVPSATASTAAGYVCGLKRNRVEEGEDREDSAAAAVTTTTAISTAAAVDDDDGDEVGVNSCCAAACNGSNEDVQDFSIQDEDDDDGSDDDDEPFNPHCTTTQVKVGCIECRIGNRLFRMQLPCDPTLHPFMRSTKSADIGDTITGRNRNNSNIGSSIPVFEFVEVTNVIFVLNQEQGKAINPSLSRH